MKISGWYQEVLDHGVTVVHILNCPNWAEIYIMVNQESIMHPSSVIKVHTQIQRC